LIDTAVEVFARNGFHATSMNDVAEAAGVTKPVLYQHFASKRDLYLQLLGDIGAQLRETIAKATSDAAGPRQQIEGGFRAYFQFVADHGDAYQVLFGSGTRRDEEFAAEARSVEASIAEVVAGLIEVEGLDESRRLLLANGIVGLAEGASRYWLRHPVDVDPADLADEVSQLAWAGLRGIR
jgi:AcrR family transcriptional regulator